MGKVTFEYVEKLLRETRNSRKKSFKNFSSPKRLNLSILETGFVYIESKIFSFTILISISSPESSS